MKRAGVQRLRELMSGAVCSGVFPGGVLLVSKGSNLVFHEAFGSLEPDGSVQATTDTLYDLASLTKPLATLLAVFRLMEKGRLHFDQPLGDLIFDLRETDKERVSIDQLLRHTSGLPAHRPYYKVMMGISQDDRRAYLRQAIVAEPLLNVPGTCEVYSDLGYILLAWVVEAITGVALSRFVTEELYSPWGIRDLFFLDVKTHHLLPESLVERIAPTEVCPWRKRLLRAEVHDDNAWAAGGIEGHAGLFGTSLGVWKLCRFLMEGLFLKSGPASGMGGESALVKNSSGTRTAGFDTPSRSGSSTGSFFSPMTIGHLGFTGTSFWIDPVHELIAILLSNRVCPSRNNIDIRRLRPEIHDEIFRCFCRGASR